MATDTDLAAAIARRARNLAAPRAQAYAAGNRVFTVDVTRPAGRPTFNRATAQMQILPGDAVYSGEARIRPLSTDGPIEIFDALTYLSRTMVSIDAGGQVSPRVDDVITITAAPPEAAAVVGRGLRVVGVSFGGHFPTGWELTCTGVEPSPETDRP